MQKFFSIMAVLLGAASASAEQVQIPAPLPADAFMPVDEQLADLGHLLFFDPLLSGNRNISCATCHHPTLGTSDAMSLSLGEGADGLGDRRVVSEINMPTQRIPRNAPALFNLGAADVTSLFHDGRVARDADAPFGFKMPDGRALERPVPSILAAQSMLPLLSSDEMAGHPGENEIADAVADERIHGPGGAWDLIAQRVGGIEVYRAEFAALNGARDIHITDIAAAIGAFIADEFRAGDSIADRYLRGEGDMPDEAKLGAELFAGKGQCASCHAGPLMTDQQFHAIAMPQIGPGKSEGDSYYQDVGRFAVTGKDEDRYRFRTPSLRNVALTAPYGHDGAFARLEDVVLHHLDPVGSLRAYKPGMALLNASFEAGNTTDFVALSDAAEVDAIAAANELGSLELADHEVAAILAFLDCLTDESWKDRSRGIPEATPSGLPLDRLH